MGIIDKVRKEKSRITGYQAPAKADKVENARLLDLNVLKQTVVNVANHHKTEVEDDVIEANRKWEYMVTYKLANIIGHVDMPTWVFMIESQIEWCIDTRTSVQPNGKWELCNVEVMIEQDNVIKKRTVSADDQIETAVPMQFLVIGFQFVDTNGARDLLYDMGRPKREAEENVTPAMLKQLLEGRGSSEDNAAQEVITQQAGKLEAQQNQINQLSDKLTQMTDIMSGLMAELERKREPLPDADVAREPVKKRRSKK
tara:strand:- start:136 stop:903 length:768 start_codon:yes stop_codon:yes gene_type:complete